MDIEIRKVDSQADPTITTFTDRVWEEYHAEHGHDPSVNWDREQVEFAAYTTEGKLAGFAGGRVSAGVGHLSELIVASGKRRQGIGAMLLSQFVDACRERGCHKIVLHTDQDGPAQAFYERHGWHVEAELPRDRGGRDFVRMARFLSPTSYEER